MAIIRESELAKQIKCDGAMATARKIGDAIKEGHLSYLDFPSIRLLYEQFVTEKGKPNEGVGRHVLREEVISEEASAVTSTDAFNVITSQLFFNVLSTTYDAADHNVAPLFRVVPSNQVDGDTIGGISNLDAVLQPTMQGRRLPSLEPTQDFSKSPQQRQIGGCVDITLQMMRADKTGMVMDMFTRLGRSLNAGREIEACSTLTGFNGEQPANGAVYNRTQYNWKNVTYATYQSSTPWVNVVSSNALINYENLQAAFLALQNILDPFTALPIATPPGRVKLIVTPTNQFIAQRLARGIQYTTTPAVSDFSPQVQTEAFPPVEIDVVSSKYLAYVLNATSQPQTNWYMTYANEAFAWFQMFPITLGEALPNAGELYRNNLAASYKAFRNESSFVFNPRYSVQNTA